MQPTARPEQAYLDAVNANPAPKRARSEPSSSNSHASSAGKGVAKIVEDWAGPKLTDVAAAHHKRAAQLRSALQSDTEAIAKLQEFSAQDKVPSSLTIKLAPAAQKLAAVIPAAEEAKKGIEKLFLTEALRQREASLTAVRAELEAVTSGVQFDLDARAATQFDSLQNVERAHVEALIASKKEEFLVTLRLSQLTMSAREEKQREAKAKRAEAFAARDVDMAQAPTDQILKRVVAETVAKEMAKYRKHANLDSRKQVHFGSRQQSRSDSRGRGRSHSKSTSRPRGTSRGKPSGRSSTPMRGPSRSQSRERPSTPRRQPSSSRSKSREPRRRQPSSSRSKSRENSRGDRGTRPHRSPSAKHAGRERSGGGSGSKMGARR